MSTVFCFYNYPTEPNPNFLACAHKVIARYEDVATSWGKGEEVQVMRRMRV